MKTEFQLRVTVVLSLIAFSLSATACAQSAKITNFAECAKVYPVMESNPRQCGTPDGRRYVEDVKRGDDKVGHLQSGITVVVIEHGHAGPTRVGEPPSYYRLPLVVKRAGDSEVVTKGAPNREGLYTFIVPPGKYFIISDDQSGTAKSVRSEEIVVVKNQFTAVKLSHDNGMRSRGMKDLMARWLSLTL